MRILLIEPDLALGAFLERELDAQTTSSISPPKAAAQSGSLAECKYDAARRLKTKDNTPF